ncbi:MAG TPA: hypothetical protein VFR24_01895 [Candidatus Angelobacter sp.]|nr:hypothetical protein [Candidatus Angelobacter sp.]
MQSEIINTYWPPDPEKIFCFILTNVSELGDKFVLQPDGMDLTDLRYRIIGNKSHAEESGHGFCRILSAGIGRLCWTFNYISLVGHSVGRKGTVYSIGYVFDASLLATYPNNFFSLLYSVTVDLHRNTTERAIDSAVENLIGHLNNPEDPDAREHVFRQIQIMKQRLLLFESQLKRPTVVRRIYYRLLHLPALLFERSKNTEIIVICIGALNDDDKLTIFNAEMSRRIYWRRLGRSALTTRCEYSSDALVRVVSRFDLNRYATAVRWRTLPSGTSYFVLTNDKEVDEKSYRGNQHVLNGKLVRIEKKLDDVDSTNHVYALVGDQIEIDWYCDLQETRFAPLIDVRIDGETVTLLYMRTVQHLGLTPGWIIGIFFSAIAPGESTVNVMITSRSNAEAPFRKHILCMVDVDMKT